MKGLRYSQANYFLIALLLISTSALAAPATKGKLQPNVLLITVDTIRADHLGCYGDQHIETPVLDGLARDGVVFDRAISQVPLTWPSHAAILTGTYPFQNGVQDFTGQPLSPKFRSVAQAFQQHGYATAAVVSSFVLDRSWGLARGFGFYDDVFSPEAFQKKELGLVERRAEESATRALDWLKKSRTRPFFLWLHLYDPHSPYDPPEPYRTQYRDHPYDGEIAYADHQLGRLITWLKQNGVYDRTAIVFLSDHGESLGQHGEDEHGFFVYDSTTHIPLIVKPPAGSGIRAGRVARPVETVAVAPALLRMAGMSDVIEKQFHSQGLFGTKAEQEDVAYSETFYPFSSFGWSPLHALETSRYHYIDAPIPELYDLVADPAENNNLASQQSATVAVLKQKLQRLCSQSPYQPAQGDSPPLSPAAQEKLQALGYVAYRSPVSAENLAAGLPDPKTRIEEFRSILKASDAFHAGDYAAGRALLNHVREADPQMYIVPFYLGEASLAEEHWDEAAAEFRKCLSLNPSFDQAMTGLARALLQLGKADEAADWMRSALKFNSQNYLAWHELGTIRARSNPSEAISAYQKAIAIQANFAPVRRDLGLLYFQQKNYSEAAVQLNKSIELGLTSPVLYNNLGVSYSRTNRLEKAVLSYREALQADPNLAEAHLNLGFAYQRLGRLPAAREEYSRACQLEEKFCPLIPK